MMMVVVVVVVVAWRRTTADGTSKRWVGRSDETLALEDADADADDVDDPVVVEVTPLLPDACRVVIGLFSSMKTKQKKKKEHWDDGGGGDDDELVVWLRDSLGSR